MHTHKTVLTSAKSGVKVERGKLLLVVSRQEFSAVGTLIEQLSLLVAKVFFQQECGIFPTYTGYMSVSRVCKAGPDQ